ncbi:hypothetical protein RIF29_30017 [Crotalaria pallida]|uniref:Uncharacterized protein n=1 Tax=Crotalaria pallida TaxID=3830 RepID=A0AAN9EME2_CROPI
MHSSSSKRGLRYLVLTTPSSSFLIRSEIQHFPITFSFRAPIFKFSSRVVNMSEDSVNQSDDSIEVLSSPHSPFKKQEPDENSRLTEPVSSYVPQTVVEERQGSSVATSTPIQSSAARVEALVPKVVVETVVPLVDIETEGDTLVAQVTDTEEDLQPLAKKAYVDKGKRRMGEWLGIGSETGKEGTCAVVESSDPTVWNRKLLRLASMAYFVANHAKEIVLVLSPVEREKRKFAAVREEILMAQVVEYQDANKNQEEAIIKLDMDEGLAKEANLRKSREGEGGGRASEGGS